MRLFQTNMSESSADWLEPIRIFHADELLRMDAAELAEMLTDDETEIRERQRIFQDCTADGGIPAVFEKILAAAEQIRILAQKETEYVTDVERTLYSVRSLQIYTDVVREIADAAPGLTKSLQSERLRAFLQGFQEIAESSSFGELCAEIQTVAQKAEGIKSVTLAVNLNAQLQPSEVGVLSINDAYFQADNVYTKFFGKPAEAGRATPLLAPDGSEQALEKALYSNINRTICKAVRKMQRNYLNQCSQIVAPIFENLRGIAFLCRASNFLLRLKKRCADYCFPEISQSETAYSKLYDPMLLERITFSDVVGNDVRFDPQGAFIYLLTGVNSGGKSVFLRSVGIGQILFQLGLCVTAQKAAVRVRRAMFAHIAAKGSDEGGRFSAECENVRRILEKCDGETLVLMDEAFSSTNSQEGAAIAYQVLRRMQASGIWCVFSTHFHEMRAYLAELSEHGGVGALCFGAENGRQTHRAEPGFIEEKNFAYEIAKKYGLEFKGAENE